jgi:hypothetical protein
LAACGSGGDDAQSQNGAHAGAGSSGSNVGPGGSSTAPSGGDAGIGGATPRYSVNDVTYLFPLPTNATQVSELLGIAATGSHGPLLSDDLYTMLAESNFPHAADDLRVVALRLDPCASQTVVKDPGSCSRSGRTTISRPMTAGSI